MSPYFTAFRSLMFVALVAPWLVACGDADSLSALSADDANEVVAEADGKRLTAGMLHDFIAVGELMAGEAFSSGERDDIHEREVEDFEAAPDRVLAYMQRYTQQAAAMRSAENEAARTELGNKYYVELVQNLMYGLVSKGGSRPLPTDTGGFFAVAKPEMEALDDTLEDLAERGDLAGVVLTHRVPDGELVQAVMVEIYRMNLNQRVVMPAYNAAMNQTRQSFEQAGRATNDAMAEHGALNACDLNPDCKSEYRLEYDSNGKLEEKLYINDTPVIPAD